MFDARAKRVRPHLDDKILASWNGLMLGAFARAYAVLGDEEYPRSREKNLVFLQEKLWESATQSAIGNRQSSIPVGTLYHRWRDGERDNVQLLEAYAFLLSGVIELYEATLESNIWSSRAHLPRRCSPAFTTANGGFWQSEANARSDFARQGGL